MLNIRTDQMRSLGGLMRRRFVDGEVARLRADRPEQAARADDAAIRRFVEQAIASAREIGCVGVRDVQRYIDLHFRLGPGFMDDPAHAELRALLEEAPIPPKLRLDRVDRRLRERGQG
jgi:hypothetical protein